MASTTGAWAVHQRIPPERWCITKREFMEFVQEVRVAWKEGRVPDSEAFPNQRHYDAKHGPNLYQVNAHYVKPITLAAGGMSYALMKHPEGLDCEVFVSHSWCEGIFQLSNSIRRAWPQLQERRNLYCCLLANPQNLDISSLLDVEPGQTPFAKALQQASHLLVVPNNTVGVYSRLWCVYEAYLGSVFNKTYLLPVKPRNSARRRVMTRTVLFPVLLGLLLGGVWQAIHNFLPRDVQNQILLWSCFILWCALGVLILVSTNMSEDPDGQCTTCIASVYVLFILSVVLGWALVIPWFETATDYENWYVFLLHFGVPGNMALMSAACVALFGQIYLEREELAHQREMMHFDSVRNARCSNPRDEERIRRAIEGREAEVDVVIRILSIAGAYNENLRCEWDAGVEITGSGFTDLTCNTCWAMFVWGASAADALSDAILWPNLAPSWFYASALVCLATMIAIPCAEKALYKQGPDRAVFALRTWIMCAVVSMLVPMLVAVAQGMDQAACLSLTAQLAAEANSWEPVYPSRTTAISVIASRFFFAAAAALCAVHGPAHWNRYWLAGVRKRRRTARADSSEEESGEVSDSSSSSRGEQPWLVTQWSRICSFKI